MTDPEGCAARLAERPSFDWLAAVETRCRAALEVAGNSWPNVATLDTRISMSLKDMPMLIAYVREGAAQAEEIAQLRREVQLTATARDFQRDRAERRVWYYQQLDKQYETLRDELRDASLRADNAEIATQQELQRIQSVAAVLEHLTFWPSPNADQNLARDIGRVLQGKAAEKSTGLEDFPAPRVRMWKARAEAAEAERDTLRAQIARLVAQQQADAATFEAKARESNRVEPEKFGVKYLNEGIAMGRRQSATELSALLAPVEVPCPHA